MPITAAPSRRRLLSLAFLAALTVSVLGACSTGGGEGDSAAPEPAAEAPGATAAAPAGVTMRLIAFRPEVLEVSAGTPVTWTQQDPGVHTVTSGSVEHQGGGVSAGPDGRFDSGELAKGETFSVTLDQPGTYAYFCNIHPATMRGEIKVTESK